MSDKPKVQENILNAMLLAQAKQEAQKAKEQFQELSKEHQKVQKEHETTKKKHETLDKEHKETKKELHKYKMQFDANYAFEKKQISKKTMERVRAAKTKKTAGVRELGKKARAESSAVSRRDQPRKKS